MFVLDKEINVFLQIGKIYFIFLNSLLARKTTISDWQVSRAVT
jgi:hypothetical protein